MEEIFKILNPRINLPHISNVVKLNCDAKYGRMIVASEKIHPGQIIVIEKPFINSLDKQKDQKRCGNCLKILIQSVICNSCGLFKFCSKNCQDEAWENFHKFECKTFHTIAEDDSYFLMINRMLFKSMTICGSLDNLIKHVKNINKSVTIFDAISNDDKFILTCCFNLECGNIFDDFKFVNSYMKSSFIKSLYKSIDQQDALKEIILKIIGILNRNSFHLKFKDRISVGALFAFSSLFNHSCSPNVEKINLGNKVAFICKKLIEENEQLFLCYRKPFYLESIEKRQKSLYQQFNFICQCEACSDEVKFSLMKINDFELAESDKKNLIREFKTNCHYISENINDFPSTNLISLMFRNRKILDKVVEIN